ncbi:MAG TPA: peroxidase [Candidatus Angelobacter sp.]
MPAVDYKDVQAIVRFGFGKMTEACYFLVRVKNAAAAKEWLLRAPVTSAEITPSLRTALQVAFTRQGLEALGVPEKVIAGFSTEFITGMTGDPSRSRRLGDVGANSPDKWRWGYEDRVPHAVVMLFAYPGQLEKWKLSIQREFWSEAFELIEYLPTTDMGGREAFGFVDGISQPDLDWEQVRKVSRNRDQLSYGNSVCLGEFLLGYPNEYDRYTDRPLLDPTAPGADALLEAADHPGKKDLGLNGSYVVIRTLKQDVRGFWQFLDKVAGSRRLQRYQLAEAMVGRTLGDGAPLVPVSSSSMAGVGNRGDEATRKQDVRLNQFTYGADPAGTACPFGAHIRRANPRNADIPGGPQGWLMHLIHILGFGNKDLRADLVSSTRFHRLLRRGREFGEKLDPDDALHPAPENDSERGLQFVAVNANIQRQFEFIQNAWIVRTKFDGLTEESDPLLGNREPVPGCPFANTFSLPQNGRVRRRIMDVPQFITVLGGAYFFLPSLRALRYIAVAGI